MKVIRTLTQMQSVSRRLRQQGRRIGFVPTMGYLHAGHLSLVQGARQECDAVVVSIYVNPRQFGPQEDFERYPRDLQRDLTLLKPCGVDYVFVPQDRQMYPAGFETVVDVPRLAAGLCGRTRPGHFQGVGTVVTKLFSIVQPDRAYFGQKDAQQAAIIQRLAADLNFSTLIRVLPTKREPDGLAMSSRNIYLNAKHRQQATALYRALRLAQERMRAGERSGSRLKQVMQRLIDKYPAVRIDYIDIVDARTLAPKAMLAGEVLIALAAYIGRVRLIDNARVRVHYKENAL